jgi:hypothetical protein
MRCSSTVCPFQWVWGAFYRKGRSVEHMGPFSQVRPDEEVRLALWSTASHFGHPWSLLLRRLRVGALCWFRPEPPSLRDAEDCLGMTVVAVDRPNKWTHWSKWSYPHLFDQTNISLVDLVHPSCAHRRGGVLDQRCATGQVQPHLAGSAAPAGSVVPGGAVVPSSCGTLVPILS